MLIDLHLLVPQICTMFLKSHLAVNLILLVTLSPTLDIHTVHYASFNPLKSDFGEHTLTTDQLQPYKETTCSKAIRQHGHSKSWACDGEDISSRA